MAAVIPRDVSDEEYLAGSVDEVKPQRLQLWDSNSARMVICIFHWSGLGEFFYINAKSSHYLGLAGSRDTPAALQCGLPPTASPVRELNTTRIVM
jgi:hypothetical protein